MCELRFQFSLLFSGPALDQPNFRLLSRELLLTKLSRACVPFGCHFFIQIGLQFGFLYNRISQPNFAFILRFRGCDLSLKSSSDLLEFRNLALEFRDHMIGTHRLVFPHIKACNDAILLCWKFNAFQGKYKALVKVLPAVRQGSRIIGFDPEFWHTSL